MQDDAIETSKIEANLDDTSDEYGFVVESWDENEDDVMEIPNTVFDGKTPIDFFNAERTDIGLAAMSGIAVHGVKPIVDAITALSYGATNLALNGKFETPTAEEMQEDKTVLPKSLVDYEPKTRAGNIVKPVAGYAYGAAVTTTALGAAGITGKAGVITNATLKGITKSKEGLAVGKILAPLVNGIATNGLVFWEDEGNLSNLLQPYVKNPTVKNILDYMAIKGDDSYAERVLKQSLEGGFVSLAASGIFNIFKGLKKGYQYMRGNKKIATESAEEIGKKVAAPIIEKKETAEEIADAVAKGQRIEPKQEFDVVNNVIEDINNTRKELALPPQEFAVPRAQSTINVAEAKEKTAVALMDYIDISNPEDLKKLNSFLEGADNSVEKTFGALKAQKDTFVGGWAQMKAKVKNAELSGGALTNAEKTEAFRQFMDNNCVAFGKTQDVLHEGALAMNVSSKDAVHRANKKVIQELKDNLDKISTPELFDAMANATTEEEVISKINAFFANAPEAIAKGGFDVKKLVALEQAGLMSSTDTIIRNAFTSVENLTLGVIDDFSESLLNAVSTKAVKNGSNKRELVDIAAKGAAYMNFFKDSALWGLQRTRRLFNKKIPDVASPWRKYREGLSRQLNTNLPTEIGYTFSNESNLGKIANGYIKMSGIGISEATDSFFDAAFFRGAAAQRVNAQARRLKSMYSLSDENAQKIAKTMLDNITNTDSARRMYDIAEINESIMAGIESAITKKSAEDAAVMTFRSGQGKLTTGVTKLFNALPALKMFVPFVKTSSTIVFDRFLYDRTIVGGAIEGGKTLLSYLTPAIKSQLRNPELRNKFLAKQATGASIMALGAYMYANGQITGDYPDDVQQRKVWQAAGIQPNSLVLTAKDGSKKFVSLNNLGVMSMLLKTPAKFAQYYNDFMSRTAKQEKIDEVETSFMENIFGASVMYGNAIVEETILRNVADFFDRMNRGFTDTKEMENWLINVSTNPAKNIIPRVFRQALSDHDYDEVVENNLKSLKGMYEGMPIRYDVFGDKQERADFATGMAGFSVKELGKEEKYKGVMAKYEMTVPGVDKVEFPTKGHSVRLTAEQMNTVYKKMGELGLGKDIRAIVESMGKEPTQGEIDLYQKIINRTYERYKKQALGILVTEDKDIGDNYNSRIDFDMNEKYNIEKRTSPVSGRIPSLADF